MSTSSRILYLLAPAIATTGALIAARNIARAVQGVAQMVLVLPIGSQLTPADVPEFVRVEYLQLQNPSKRILALPRYVIQLVTSSLALRRAMARDGATHLILNDFYLLHGVLLRLMGYRGTITQWVRCDPVRFAGSLAGPMLWLTHCATNQLVAVSHFIEQKLPPSPKLRMIYDAFTGQAAVQRPTSWITKPLLFVGNYIEGKGQDVALEALAIALKADDSLRLQFYGGDVGLTKNRAYLNMLKARSMALGITDKVTFGEFAKDLSPYLQSAFAALNFSTSESFSMTVLEASGFGLPVIATRSGGPQEIIEDGITGYLIPVNDITQAAEKILALASDPKSAASMGTAASLRVRTHFSVVEFERKIRELLTLA